MSRAGITEVQASDSNMQNGSPYTDVSSPFSSMHIDTDDFNAREKEDFLTNKTKLIANIRKPFRGKDLLHRIVMLASASLSLSPNGSSAEKSSIAIEGTPLSSARLLSQGVRAGLTGASVPPVGPHAGPDVPLSASAASLSASGARRPGAIRAISGKYPLRILLSENKRGVQWRECLTNGRMLLIGFLLCFFACFCSAEDNIVNQKMMVMLLKKLGYSIAVAENGVEALKHLAQQTARGREYEVQVILMDASMAVMDGLECTRVIRAQQLPHRTRPYIVAQTANVTDEFRKMCLASGMDCFSQPHTNR